MAPPEVWGPPIWIFFHTITTKVKDGLDVNVYKGLFRIIKTICKNLPCPECSSDATQFLSKITRKQQEMGRGKSRKRSIIF